jgi:hypothetical protein
MSGSFVFLCQVLTLERPQTEFGMHGARRLALALLLVVVSGCDRTPTDPTLQRSNRALLDPAVRASVYAPSSTALPELFRKATTKVLLDHGPDAQRRLLRNWRLLNEQAEAALKGGDRHLAADGIAAVRSEEIRTVLRVLGADVAGRTVRMVGATLDDTRQRLNGADAKGKPTTRARVQVTHIDALLIQAEQALSAGNAELALDLATKASDDLDTIIHFLISLDRVAGVETMFTDVVASITRERGGSAARALTAKLEQFNAETNNALQRGNRDRTRQFLELARREQIRIVLEAHGPSVVTRLMQQVDAAAAAARDRLAERSEPMTTDRVGRMLGQATDLNRRARRAADRGDFGEALDLASHAAGLVNAAQHLLPRQ